MRFIFASLFCIALFAVTDAPQAQAEPSLKLPKINLDQFQKNFDKSLSDSLQMKKFRKDDTPNGLPGGTCCGEDNSIGQIPDICQINPKLPQCEQKG